MKRLGVLFVFALLGTMTAGCGGGGLKEGQPTEVPKSSMSDSHKAFMEANAAKMQLMKGKPKNMAPPKAAP